MKPVMNNKDPWTLWTEYLENQFPINGIYFIGVYNAIRNVECNKREGPGRWFNMTQDDLFAELEKQEPKLSLMAEIIDPSIEALRDLQLIRVRKPRIRESIQETLALMKAGPRYQRIVPFLPVPKVDDSERFAFPWQLPR
jgi:hypothetical protein